MITRVISRRLTDTLYNLNLNAINMLNRFSNAEHIFIIHVALEGNKLFKRKYAENERIRKQSRDSRAWQHDKNKAKKGRGGFQGKRAATSRLTDLQHTSSFQFFFFLRNVAFNQGLSLCRLRIILTHHRALGPVGGEWSIVSEQNRNALSERECFHESFPKTMYPQAKK